jgi:poly(3-hydroxybutyrate) depolymerase
MTSRTLLAAAAAVLLLGTASVAQTSQSITFNVAGKARSAVVHVPSGTSKPPVVFFIHGYGGSGAGFENDTKGDKVADREKFIAVYPSAVSGSWSMYDTADYPFLLALLDTVDARYKIDRNRVYCTGFSQGGFISFGVGYKHPEVFAAVAPVSGHIPSFSTAAPLKRPVPMFLTFGTNDVSNVASFMTDLNTWLKLDSCNLASKKEVRPYPATRKNSVVARITYACAQGSVVMVDSVVGGPHEWAMDTVAKVNTTEEVWAFLKQFSLSSTTPTTAIHPAAADLHLAAVANFHDSKVSLPEASGIETVRVTNLQGKLIATATVTNQSFELGSRPQGMYLVTGTGKGESRTFKVLVP